MKLMVRTQQFVCAAPSSSHFPLALAWLFLGLQSFRMSLLNVGSLWLVVLIIRAFSSLLLSFPIEEILPPQAAVWVSAPQGFFPQAAGKSPL